MGKCARVASITAKSAVVDTKMTRDVATVCGGSAMLTALGARTPLM